MTRQIEAVFEGGVLRPLEPLFLEEHQRVLVTVDDKPEEVAITPMPRRAEMDWVIAHAGEYRGQWVAVQGDQLISHGPNARAVLDEARAKGVEQPILHRFPKEPEIPSAGWL